MNFVVIAALGAALIASINIETIEAADLTCVCYKQGWTCQQSNGCTYGWTYHHKYERNDSEKCREKVSLNGYHAYQDPVYWCIDKYFLAEEHQKCDKACEEKGLTCNNKVLEDAAADYDTCKSIIRSLKVVPVEGGGTMSIYDYDGLTGDSAGCTWHGSYVQLLTKGNDKPKCDSDIRSGTSRRRVCACKP